MDRYKLFIRKFNFIKGKNEVIEEIVDTDDIYHTIGYLYCNSLEHIERIDYKKLESEEK